MLGRTVPLLKSTICGLTIGAVAAVASTAVGGNFINELKQMGNARAAQVQNDPLSSDEILQRLAKYEQEILAEDEAVLRDELFEEEPVVDVALDTEVGGGEITTPAPALPDYEIIEPTVQVAGVQNDNSEVVGKLEAQVAKLETLSNEALTEAEKTKSQLVQRETEMAALVDTKSKQELLITELNNKVAELQAKNQQLANAERLSLSEIQKAETELASARGKNEELKNRLAQQKGDFQAFSEQLEARDVTAAKLREELQRTRAGQATLEKKIQKSRQLEEDNSFLRKEIEELNKDFIVLKGTVAENDLLKQQLSETRAKLGELTTTAQDATKTINQLRGEADDYKGKHARLQTKYDQRARDLSEKNDELQGMSRQLSRTIQEVQSCEAHLASSKKEASRVTVLENEIIQKKNELLLKDTEIELLAKKPVAAGPVVTERAKPSPRQPNKAAMRASLGERGTAVSSDVLVAVVKVGKANLRTGPGTEHSPAMQVRAGTRLTVESRQGDWYRVLTPTGSRAYVRSDMVTVSGSQPALRPQRATNDSPDEETQAFESLRRAMRQAIK